ncbi:MAG TPA: efflux RND transporter periplasmic adaptor subunit [Gemmataceae bacterium]|jgi:multidrug efflux system membrane fusion protein|nr:efflux RND transporter periplasmic adaptor subunit [Gemmataceae bacterium]
MKRCIRPTFAGSVLAGIVVTVGVAGCQKAPPALAKTKDPEVIVARPTSQPVIDHEDFTGHIEAENKVVLQAQVTGYLLTAHVKDGADVEKDQLLFEIDSQVYETEYTKSKSTVLQAEARRDRLERDLRRVTLVPDKGTVTQEEVDKIAGDLAEARAAVGVATAQRELARQNVEFTKIKAPFSGRLGKRNIDPKNLVKANDTVLATLVSRNPIYASFDLDEQTLLRLRRLVQDGKIVSARTEPTKVHIGVADEEGYSFSGIITVIDNIVDPGTGTQRVWATIDNSKFLLSPGMFVRIRLPVGKPKPSLLVPEEALGSDQGQRYVFVLNENDEVVYRPVKLGPQVERLRVIDDGVTASDRVIVSGLQRVRAGVKVVPKDAAAVKPTT